MSEPLTLETPLNSEDVSRLKAGDLVFINGVVFTARDAAHKNIIETIEQGGEPPFPLQGAAIFYVGPTPPPPGMVIGSAGPTSSYRMDPYTPPLLAQGLKIMIGKGKRGAEVKEAMQKHQAAYLVAIGGAGARIAKCIKKAEVLAYPELGPEAIRRLEVENMPLICANDAAGGDLYQMGAETYKR